MNNTEELTPTAAYQPGEPVVFANERGTLCVGRVASIDDHGVQGEIGIALLGGWSYGLYSRSVRDVRPAQHWEVHQAEFQIQNFSENGSADC